MIAIFNVIKQLITTKELEENTIEQKELSLII